MKKVMIICLVLACLMIMGSAALCMTIDKAKRVRVGTDVTVTGCVTYVEPGECYIQSTDKPDGGIWVRGIVGYLIIGDVITVTGTLAVDSNEHLINAASVSMGGRADIEPFTIENKWIGGATAGIDTFILDYKMCETPDGTSEYRWKRAVGATNTGLLVKTFGKVTAVYSTPATLAAPGCNWFYIDDGSELVSDFGDIGVLVYSNAEVKVGDYVSVTGVSTIEQAYDVQQRLVRVLRASNADDVEILERLEPAYPFSDEFDESTLNSKWAVKTLDLDRSTGTSGSISLTDNPGMLTVYARDYIQLMQYAPGDWDMELKVQPEFTTGHYQSIHFDLFNPNEVNNIGEFLVSIGPDFTFDNLIGVTFADFSNSYPVMTRFFGLEGNTAYVYFKKRGNTVDMGLSTDGTTYIHPTPNPVSIKPSDTYFTMNCYPNVFAEPNGIGVPFTAKFEYVRFTRVTQ